LTYSINADGTGDAKACFWWSDATTLGAVKVTAKISSAETDPYNTDYNVSNADTAMKRIRRLWKRRFR